MTHTMTPSVACHATAGKILSVLLKSALLISKLGRTDGIPHVTTIIDRCKMTQGRYVEVRHGRPLYRPSKRVSAFSL